MAGSSDTIFISHASRDRRIAETVCSALENRGFRCWLANRDVLGGDNFQASVVRAIRAAKVMLLVFTANANNSDEIKKELVLASQNRVIVIPLRVEDVAPDDAFAYELATRQWVDMFEDWEQALERLVTRLGSFVARVPQSDVEAAVAPEPPRVRTPGPAAQTAPTDTASVREEKLAIPSVSDAPRPTGTRSEAITAEQSVGLDTPGPVQPIDSINEIILHDKESVPISIGPDIGARAERKSAAIRAEPPEEQPVALAVHKPTAAAHPAADVTPRDEEQEPLLVVPDVTFRTKIRPIASESPHPADLEAIGPLPHASPMRNAWTVFGAIAVIGVALWMWALSELHNQRPLPPDDPAQSGRASGPIAQTPAQSSQYAPAASPYNLTARFWMQKAADNGDAYAKQWLKTH